MKLMWLCNMVPGAVLEKETGKKSSGGLWVDHVLSDLRKEELSMHIVCPGGEGQGQLDDRCAYTYFSRGVAYQYDSALEEKFLQLIQTIAPDVIHIWGTEYAHTLAMVNASQRANCLERVVISIQGLCSVYADHYAEGVPYKVQREFTFRDFVKQDNIRQQQRKFALRGAHEVRALQQVRHIIGRTAWDKACATAINPQAQYHLCNETLREPFFTGAWGYETCQKHRIFVSSAAYPVKGFHYMLEAMAEVVKHYPDAKIAVTGESFLSTDSLRNRIRSSSYRKYLTSLVRKYDLEDKILFLGSLSAEQMKEQYLLSNVFAMPSTIENSPNSLGEAMLLGVPCVASDVGGVTTMMTHGEEGYVYQSTAPYMLAHYIKEVFAQQDKAGQMGKAAAQHARKTHDAENNLHTLLRIYRSIAQ